RQNLAFTERVKARQPISSEELNKYKDLDKRMANYVVGVEDVLTRLKKMVMAMRDGRGKHLTPQTATHAAEVLAFFGMTSTGKTQTPKALAKALYGSEKEFVNISFGNVEHPHQLDEL